jgi:hypothetical protein
MASAAEAADKLPLKESGAMTIFMSGQSFLFVSIIPNSQVLGMNTNCCWRALLIHMQEMVYYV